MSILIGNNSNVRNLIGTSGKTKIQPKVAEERQSPQLDKIDTVSFDLCLAASKEATEKFIKDLKGGNTEQKKAIKEDKTPYMSPEEMTGLLVDTAKDPGKMQKFTETAGREPDEYGKKWDFMTPSRELPTYSAIIDPGTRELRTMSTVLKENPGSEELYKKATTLEGLTAINDAVKHGEISFNPDGGFLIADPDLEKTLSSQPVPAWKLPELPGTRNVTVYAPGPASQQTLSDGQHYTKWADALKNLDEGNSGSNNIQSQSLPSALPSAINGFSEDWLIAK